ncbi:MmgE/PrpD family protein [Streptomyces sp. NPDC050625]|uniref:MmgE/PrpD family protein n=1 Tax=Streptomyces sp. NPDC050625 TaxID=3154629 RepID=UPI003417DB9B
MVEPDVGFHDNTTSAIASWAASVRRADIPESTVRALVGHHLDTVACAVGAMSFPPAVATRDIACESPTDRGVSVLGAINKVAPEAGIFANTAMVRYLDLNDNYFRLGGGHTSDLIPALWAAAELTGASGAALVEGLHVGYEVHMALADAVDLRDRGWDYPAFISIATAAATSRMLGLSVDQTAHALAMTITGTSAPLGSSRVGELGNWKALASSHAVMNGFIAARLASRGVTGPSRVIEGHRGFQHLVTGPFSLEHLGRPRDGFTAGERSAYKLHVADFNTQTVVQEFVELHRQGVRPDDIDSVTIAVPWVTWSECGGGQDDHDEKWDPKTKETADHSIPYVASVALVDGFVQKESYLPERYLDPALRPIMAKIEVVADAEITKTWVEKPTNVITLRLKSGEVRAIRTDYPRGHHLNPVEERELVTKFEYQCRSLVSSEIAERLLATLQKLDSLDTLGEMFADMRSLEMKVETQ